MGLERLCDDALRDKRARTEIEIMLAQSGFSRKKNYFRRSQYGTSILLYPDGLDHLHRANTYVLTVSDQVIDDADESPNVITLYAIRGGVILIMANLVVELSYFKKYGAPPEDDERLNLCLIGGAIFGALIGTIHELYKKNFLKYDTLLKGGKKWDYDILNVLTSEQHNSHISLPYFLVTTPKVFNIFCCFGSS